MLRNMAVSLLTHERIMTTLPKAKELRRVVEPMITLRSPRTRLLDDEWTVVTADGGWAAHFEHTFTLTEQGPWVLTALDGGAARLV